MKILAVVIITLLGSLCQCQRISQSGSDWYLRFRSERDLDRLETVRYDVLSYVDNDFVKTTVSRVVSNPANISKEYILEIRLPQTAFISDIEIDNYKIAIIPQSDQSPSKHEDSEDKHSQHNERPDQYENFDLFRLPVTIGARDNVTLSVTYQDLLQHEGTARTLELFLSPGEIVREFSVQVDINRDGAQILETVVTAPVLGDISNETVADNEQEVNFNMNTREQAYYFGTKGAYGTVVIEIRSNQTEEDVKQQAALGSTGETQDDFILDYFLNSFHGIERKRPTSKVSQLMKLHLLLDQSRKTMEKIGELRISSMKSNSSEVYSYSELMSSTSKGKILIQ